MIMVDPFLVKGGRAVLVEQPTGYESHRLPLTVGAVYLVQDFDGSSVGLKINATRFTEALIHRSRVRGVTRYARVKGIIAFWECFCDGVRFTFLKHHSPDGSWLCKAYGDGDEWRVTAHTRDEGVRELYQMVRDARISRHRVGGAGTV